MKSITFTPICCFCCFSYLLCQVYNLHTAEMAPRFVVWQFASNSTFREMVGKCVDCFRRDLRIKIITKRFNKIQNKTIDFIDQKRLKRLK